MLKNLFGQNPQAQSEPTGFPFDNINDKIQEFTDQIKLKKAQINTEKSKILNNENKFILTAYKDKELSTFTQEKQKLIDKLKTLKTSIETRYIKNNFYLQEFFAKEIFKNKNEVEYVKILKEIYTNFNIQEKDKIFLEPCIFRGTIKGTYDIISNKIKNNNKLNYPITLNSYPHFMVADKDKDKDYLNYIYYTIPGYGYFYSQSIPYESTDYTGPITFYQRKNDNDYFCVEIQLDPKQQGGTSYKRTTNKHKDKSGVQRTIYVKNNVKYVKKKKNNKFVYVKVT